MGHAHKESGQTAGEQAEQQRTPSDMGTQPANDSALQAEIIRQTSIISLFSFGKRRNGTNTVTYEGDTKELPQSMEAQEPYGNKDWRIDVGTGISDCPQFVCGASLGGVPIDGLFPDVPWQADLYPSPPKPQPTTPSLASVAGNISDENFMLGQ